MVHIAHVCKWWNRVVLARFYHLKAYRDPSGEPESFQVHPMVGPSFGFSLNPAGRVSNAAVLLRFCRVLDVNGSFLAKAYGYVGHDIAFCLALIDTIRLAKHWEVLMPYYLTIPRLVFLDEQPFRFPTLAPPHKCHKAVFVRETPYKNNIDTCFYSDTVEFVVILFLPRQTSTITTPDPASGVFVGGPLPEGLLSLIKIISAAHFSNVRVTVVNAESLYIPNAGPGPKPTVQDLVEGFSPTATDFGTRLRLTNPPFHFLTLEQYRASVGEYEFALETNGGYLPM